MLHGYTYRHRSHHQTKILPPGMVQLHKEFCAVALYTPCELRKRLNVVIVADRELGKCGCPAEIIDTGDLGYDQPRAAARTRFIIIHHFLGRSAVELPEAEHHRRHNDAVPDLYIADLSGGEQLFVRHDFRSPLVIIQRLPAVQQSPLQYAGRRSYFR